MTLAEHVRILGRGPGRARSLTQEEAAAAMALMLEGAAPEAVGALLMLLRMKGETAAEIAGFAQATRAGLPPLPRPDLDWPCYAAGHSRGLPWFLLSARLVARAGYSVLLHGWNGPDGSVRAGLAPAGISSVEATGTEAALAGHGIAYLPLETLSPALLALLRLREVLGLRSCINTVCRVLNPGAAPASVQGVFHPPYRLLQAEAGALLGLPALTVIKGGGGEFERHPAKAITGFGLRRSQPWERVFPELLPEQPRRLDDGETDPARLAALWDGRLVDPFVEAAVLGTAALALDTLGVRDGLDRARALWSDRRTPAIA